MHRTLCIPGIAVFIAASLVATVTGSATAAPIVAGWHTISSNSENPDVSLAGFNSSTLVKSSGEGPSNESSFDGTYGSTGGSVGTTADDGSYKLRTDGGDNVLRLTLQNNSSEAVSLATVHFDYGVPSSGATDNAPKDLELKYLGGGGLGGNDVTINTVSNLSLPSGPDDDWLNFDWDLSPALMDTTLGAGEQAQFDLIATNANNSVANSLVDNVAVTAIPEPAGFLLVGLGGVLLWRRGCLRC